MELCLGLLGEKKLKEGWDWVLVEEVRKINRNTSRGVNAEETGRDTEREKVREATREERRLKQSRDATATQRWHFILTPEQECVASWYLRRKGFSLSLSLSPFNLILSRALYWKLIPPIIIERSEEQPWHSGSEQAHSYLSPPTTRTRYPLLFRNALQHEVHFNENSFKSHQSMW